MRINLLFQFFVALLLLAGCKVLSGSQIKNVNAFATCANSYSDFPAEVFKIRAKLHLNNELLQASQFTNADIINRTVTNARNHYKVALLLSDKFDLSLKLLQQYSGLLVKLTAESYNDDLGTNTKEL